MLYKSVAALPGGLACFNIRVARGTSENGTVDGWGPVSLLTSTLVLQDLSVAEALVKEI